MTSAKWEYLVVTVQPQPGEPLKDALIRAVTQLNTMGGESWELTTVNTLVIEGRITCLAWMKRPQEY